MTVYIVIRYWPGGKLEYLGASLDENVARRFAVQHVSTNGDSYIMIQTTQMVDQ